MEGRSPGSSEAGCSSTWREESGGDAQSKEEGRKEAWTEESLEKERVFSTCDSPCTRGCAPGECTLKLGTEPTISIGKEHDFVSIWRGGKFSYSNFLRNISSSQDVKRMFFDSDRWDENIGRFFGEVCEIVKSMPSVKWFRLSLFAGRTVTLALAEALSKLLAGNSTLIQFDLYLYTTVEAAGVTLLVNALLENQALQIFELCLGLGTLRSRESVASILGDLCRYVKGPNNALTRLDIEDDLVSVDGVEPLAALICNNKSLKCLSLCPSNMGLHTLWDSLGSNTVLETLILGHNGMAMEAPDLKALVKVLIPNPTQLNSSLRILQIEGIPIGIEEVTTLLQFNTSLSWLALQRVKDLMVEYCDHAYENVDKLLTSLHSNVSLEVLDLNGCTAIGGKKVLGMMMDMLLHNHTIKMILLNHTPLYKNGDHVIVNDELNKRAKENLWESVQDMDTTNPDSARLFLCGNGEAGKTTLSHTWTTKPTSTHHDVHSDHQASYGFVQILKKLCACVPRKPKQRNMTTHSSQDDEVKNERTHGIEVHNMPMDGVNFTIWDMAGQEEYHTFHDWIIPNRSATGNCCAYMVLCDPSCKTSPIRDVTTIKQELVYWLQFVASNTRRSFVYRPHITIVFTHVDLWGSKDLSKYALGNVFDELHEKFQNLLQIDFLEGSNYPYKPFFINAQSQIDGNLVIKFVHNNMRLLLKKLPKELKACKALQSIIDSRNKKGDELPFLTWKEFSIMCEEVDGLKSIHDVGESKLAKRKEFAAASLHDGGFIIYFKGIDMVILNPHWFCHDIMGELLSKCTTLDVGYQMITDGVISKKDLQEIFKNSLCKAYCNVFDTFLAIIMKLQICYEQADGGIMIPSTLHEDQDLTWHNVFQTPINGGHNYVGTRLTSKDETLTILTPGFFPRLQVFLQTKFCTPTYKSYKDLISFIHGDIEIIIARDRGSINIMSRSFGERDHLIHKDIIIALNELRSTSTLGCPGVILEEYVIRPECVKQWLRAMDVTSQVVAKQELQKKVLFSPSLDYRHPWTHNERFVSGCDSVKALMGYEDWGEVLQKKIDRSREMEEFVEWEIRLAPKHVPGDSNTTIQIDSQNTLEELFPSTKEFRILFEKVDKLQHTVEGMDKKIDQIKNFLEKMENNILISQQKLVSKVCANIDELMRFSKHLQQARVPKLAYICESQSVGLKNLLTRMVPTLKSGHLHLMCEDKNDIHMVKDQCGCKVHFGTEQARTIRTIIYWGLTLVTMLLKVGAHVVAGAGSLVPDLTKDIMLILDSPGLLDLAHLKGPMLDCLPPEVKNNATITDMDKKMAKDWLVAFLKPKCESNDIHTLFQLNKVTYTNKINIHAGSIAWVCDQHMKEGQEDGTMERV